VTRPYPGEHGPDLIGHPTLADALLDRLVHNAYRLHLTGESMRKRQKTLTRTEPSGS
jgi:DNA replication protein DnaC